MKKQNRLVGIVIALLLLAASGLACGGRESGEGTEAPPAATSTVAPTASPTEPAGEATEPPAASPTEEPQENGGLAELTVTSLDPQGAGLGGLGTFRQMLVTTFTGEGGEEAGGYTYRAEVDTDAQAVHFSITGEMAAADLPAGTIEVIWIGDQAWFKVDELPWLPYPESVEELPFDEQVFSAGDFVPYATQFQRVDERPVNGVVCAYYTYEGQEVVTQHGTVSDAHGDVCVALEGGYVVRYTLEGEGSFSGYYYVGSGTVHMAYDTYDVGAAIEIVPPR